MKGFLFTLFSPPLFLGSAICLFSLTGLAGDTSTNASLAVRPQVSALREKELKSSETNKSTEAITRFKEEWKGLTPGERSARLKAIRERNTDGTPEEREARVTLVRARIRKRLEELAVKKKAGTITPDEEKQLEKGERTLKRYEEQKMKLNTRPAPPQKVTDAQDK
jgi:hypothetical protein